MKNHYDGRFGTSRMFGLKANRRPEDEKGLVAGHEQSIYS